MAEAVVERAISPENLKAVVAEAVGDLAKNIEITHGEVVLEVDAKNYEQVALVLKNAPGCLFEQMIDLCGVDMSTYREGLWEGARFCVVLHLLSVSLNQRIRLRVFCTDDDVPCLSTVTHIWSSANWFEREAFDLFGIVFEGHGDLRRILTDYGFVGHPFRKDFPLSGYVEMRYDVDRQRVVYEPVSIETREITPRIIREEQYGGING